MGKNTKPKTPTTPQAVLEEAVKVSEEIKTAADFTDLGEAVDYAMTIADPAKKEAYFADLKPLRDITAFDFYSKVKKPLIEMQAATATGNTAAANTAAAKVGKGLEAFAKISPEFRTYVQGLEDRIKTLEARQDEVEACLAALTRGEHVKPFVPYKERSATPTPTKPLPVQPKPPITNEGSSAPGVDDEEPSHKRGFFGKIVDAFKLGSGKDSDLPAQGKYWNDSTPTNAASGTHGKE